jgi:ribose-phosphate pyrophosphokinase
VPVSCLLMREITVFSGSAHPHLGAEICSFLGVPLQAALVRRFSNDCIQVQLKANCRERDVFIVQPLAPPVQEHLVELLLMLDAARDASAARVTAVIPHYAYARSDKKDAPRISIGARLVADLIVAAGASRVLTMSLHAMQVHGFFSIPVDHLNALHELAAHFAQDDLSNATVVSPDLGNAKSASVFARMLGTPVAAGTKERLADDRVVISTIVGEITGRDVIVLDDEIANGGTVIELLARLRERKVGRISIACTHGLFTGRSIERLAADPGVSQIVSTNTVPISDEKRQAGRLTVLSVAPLMAEAIRRIHDGESVSSLFHGVPGGLDDGTPPTIRPSEPRKAPRITDTPSRQG